MIGREFDSSKNLIRWIRVAFLRTPRDIIERVLDEWIDQVERCISHEGSYFPRRKKWPISFGSFMMAGDNANNVIGHPETGRLSFLRYQCVSVFRDRTLITA
jgi:hypothetical protein